MSQALNDLERVLSGAGVREQKQEQKPDPVTKVTETLEEIKNKLSGQASQQGAALQQLLSDPDIVKVLKAKQEGRPVQISDDVKKDQPSQQQVSDQDLDDPKKLAQYLLQQTIPQIRGIIEQEIAPMKQDLASRLQQEQTQKQVEFDKRFAAVQTEPDFEALVPTMRQLNMETGQKLMPDDLLILARARASQLTPKGERQITASERPTSEATVPSRSETFVPGPRGMEDAVARAYDRASKRKANA